MTAFTSTVDTPIGPFTTVVAGDGAVLASGWTASLDELMPQVSASLKPEEIKERRDLGEVTRAVRAYHSGELGAVAEVPVRQRAGAFTEQAWDALRLVPAGQPVSYARYAELAGRPAAVRAAATACAKNAAALFVPCHRVVRTGGAIGNFRWGVDAKRWLLEHEG
ncbi:methylated-DNA--[protein]-cysteine S-methyltransferase [Actinosynnema mirum]|uniref:Methylated-DNA/protein-cysteinemethyltransferase n=1 Tax=Actinosynnema mirum (strain ATCC 29888 / DSM 43827 / JCM 3225 / NBRC 14064 / NCIMB 13271 / NRRL B-12336 / IMRU 3971 / 101) TaxID=446462 RepID=C6WKU2_ACTMD|nr:methylated-DNA--[protein]-cysteine S-methyltransferase [Actinosynnema mirum]ACU34697.1 methylated-DNA/protein-cysteinemethyltransferase [Actinosynnema mirum DSM 43827]AXX28057.1 Methylated-DNA--protein-cysteine methyltransferase [Actinosynnema pretiosum subsp. pretiosum]